MNARAAELGMNDTHFETCTGLYPENHYISSYDIAVMSKELLSHKKVLDYTTIWMETISEGRKSPFTLVNRNKMVRGYSGCDGLKTGYIKESLYCMSATAARNGVRFISVIMGAQTYKDRNYQAGKLLDLGFSKYESIKVVNKDENLGQIKLQKSVPEILTIKASEDLNVIVEKGRKLKLDKKIEVFKDLKLPLKKGSKVGIIKAVEGNNVHGQIPIIIEVDVRKMNFADVLKKPMKIWLNIE
jgi:D-alanyl-D-alanine carboxypeptidase (penicillin-binding protein 5/6)